MRRLHIGGQVAAPGWEILDVVPGPHVDHVRDAGDLSVFPDGSFAELYASHVLEHFSYRAELLAVLREWSRVLQPGGMIYISVPDLDILCRMFLDRERFSPADRAEVMRMMFGGHQDEHDLHKVGLNEEFLTGYLNLAEFVDIRRVTDFGLFQDTSVARFHNVPVSLNMTARKPP